MAATEVSAARRAVFDASNTVDFPAGECLEIIFSDGGRAETLWVVRSKGAFVRNDRLYGVMITSTANIPWLGAPYGNWMSSVLRCGSPATFGHLDREFTTGPVTEAFRTNRHRRILGG